jgi:pyruvate formate lyase activating enzyme
MIETLVQVEAQFYTTEEEDRVRCLLCPQHCLIRPGKVGFCFIRGNRNGRLYALSYGRVSGAYLDPIEKKPLYHFYPGTTIFSIGGIGCNLRCLWCQNWNIAQPRDTFLHLNPENVLQQFTVYMPPEEVVKLAKQHSINRCIGIAYTYNEPFIWYEYVTDCAKLAHQEGLKNVLVTNGYVEEEPLQKILPLIDAMNIDIKGFSEEFYRRVSGKLSPVLRTAEMAKKAGCHIELTNLVIPTLNDKVEDFKKLVNWIADKLGPDTPLHFSRYFPAYKFDIEPTPLTSLKTAEKIAAVKLKYVHLGNI